MRVGEGGTRVVAAGVEKEQVFPEAILRVDTTGLVTG